MKHTVPHADSVETICALSSGSLPSGVAVVRVSGRRVRFVVETIAGEVSTARAAELRTFKRLDGTLLDRGLLLYFPGPSSFTGEDVAELHVHGGRAVVAALLQDICSLPGCRLAESGEFTRRAFVNGKMDLLAAEATADLVTAETEAQRRFASFAGDGRQARLYDQWRQTILEARAAVEAELDFSDQDDVGNGVADRAWAGLDALTKAIGDHVAAYSKVEALRDGFRVVLIGPPNAGKSSLLNALVRRDVAIVTDEPGTTRDALDVRLDLDGISVVVTDTAGLRETQSKAERIGVERSVRRARSADLIVEVEDASSPPTDWSRPMGDVPRLRLGNKLDLCVANAPHGEFDILLSAATGQGVGALLNDISRRASAAAPGVGEIIPWRQRHVDLLNACRDHLNAANGGEDIPLELRAEELRLASDCLGRLAGRVDVEDVLGSIFSQFCIGK